MFPLESKATLLIDGSEVDFSREFANYNPNKAQLRATDVTEDIRYVEVFFIGVFRIKIAIFVNGEPVFQEPISWADKMQAKFFRLFSA